jgi:hypothetical protein
VSAQEVKLSPVLTLWDYKECGIQTYVFWCPACDEHHSYQLGPGNRGWQFDGNAESPTFTPSLLLKRSRADYEGCGPRCHLFVTAGKIAYCSDCEHEYAGRTVDMVPVDGAAAEATDSLEVR